MSNKNMLRRKFMRNALALAGLNALRTSSAAGAASGDTEATHNWMLVGKQTAFLSHLPMFDHLNESGNDYVTPHRYQVILQVSFARGPLDVTQLYFADREGNPATKMFTVSPGKPFVLTDLTASQPLSSFDATIFRGHLERGGKPVPKLDNVTVKVEKVLHFHKFDPAVQAPEALKYLLFGRGKDLFLAHSILKPPDFDQILSVEVSPATLSDDQLQAALGIHGALDVEISGRGNTAVKRIQEKEQSLGIFGAGEKLKIGAVREFYFEEGELMMPATFRPTREEIKAGFSG
jgi:hypothetical protein